MNIEEEVKKLQKTAGILKEAVVGQPQGVNTALKSPSTAPQKDARSGDVKNYEKSQKQASNVQSRAANINNVQEFQDTFEIWLKTLNISPKSFNRGQLRAAVEKGLVKLGYK